MRLSFEELLERKHEARLRREDKFLARTEKIEARAERLIGELVRDGREVLYVWPAGGTYREGSRPELISFLIRNHYV
jgi:hypothetical protein